MPTPAAIPSLETAVVTEHDRHELTWVCTGSVVVEIEDSRWRLTPEQALWIPAGIQHRVIPQAHSLVFPLFFEAVEFPTPWPRPMAIQRTPLLGVLAEVKLQPGLTTEAAVGVAEHGIHELLPRLALHTLALPMPMDPRALSVAEGILAQPASPFTLEQWAERVHTSSKTLQRCFVNETRMRFPEWRTAARLAAALPLLERGDQVSHVSVQVGYISVSSFITAFSRRFGHTPARHRSRIR